MDTEANRATVRAAFDLFEREKDMRPFLRLVAPDVRWTVIGSTWVSGEYRSLEEFLGVVRRIGERVDGPIAPTVRRIIADGDVVVVLWDGEAVTHDGMPYNNRYAWVLRFEGERIVEVTAYLDTDLMVRIAPPGS